MQLLCKTKNTTFCAELNHTLPARQIAAQLPLKAALVALASGFYFDPDINAVSLTGTTRAKPGDIIYISEKKRIAFFLSGLDQSDNTNPELAGRWTIIGHTLTLPQELETIDLGDKVELTQMANNDALDHSRKLSQNEIDNLIKELLNKK